MKSPPTVKHPRHWLLGPAYYGRRDPLTWIGRWIREYGDIFTIASPFGRGTVIARPEWVQHVLSDAYPRYTAKSRAYLVLRILFGNGLVTSEGEFWRGQRKLIQPAFHRRRLDQLFAMMVERTNACAEKLADAARAGRTIDVGPVFSQLTLEIIARAMFSTDVEGAAADVSRHIATLNEYALQLLRQPWLFLLPQRYPTPFNYRPYQAMRSLNDIVYGIIKSRRQHPDQHDDLLAMLLSACDEETGRGMTDQQLRDEVMTIFVAGHETTANALTWLTYLVGQHPDVEEALDAEISAQWPAEGLNSANANLFPYARQVVEESLRIYPSIWSVGRCSNEPDTIDEFQLPAGRNVVIPIFHLHWNERFWPEPQRFDPGRFSPSRRPPATPMIYFPFGAGPRSCIGNHFALQELMIMTVLLQRRFAFRLEPGFVVEPDPLITLRPKHGMRMAVKRK